MPFSTEFATARAQAGLTQAEAADALTSNGIKVALRTVESWEGGKSTPPEGKAAAVLQVLRALRKVADPPPSPPPSRREGYTPLAEYLARLDATEGNGSAPPFQGALHLSAVYNDRGEHVGDEYVVFHAVRPAYRQVVERDGRRRYVEAEPTRVGAGEQSNG